MYIYMTYTLYNFILYAYIPKRRICFNSLSVFLQLMPLAIRITKLSMEESIQPIHSENMYI